MCRWSGRPELKVLRVYGWIAVDAQPDEEEVAIHDPAEYAAMALKGMCGGTRCRNGEGFSRASITMDAKGFQERMKEPGQEATVSGGVVGGVCCRGGGSRIRLWRRIPRHL